MKETPACNSESKCPIETSFQTSQHGLIFEEISTKNPVCNVCLREMDESVYRIIIFQDKGKNLKVKKFHFFFPCWDIDYICQKYLDCKIVNLGFSCEKSILKNHKKVRNLQRNLSLWV